MPEDNTPVDNNEAAPENESKMYSEEELQRIVKKRLKNHISQNEALQRQLGEMQAPAAPVPAPAINGTPAPVVPQGPQEPPEDGSTPLTADSMRSIMEDSRQKALEASQTQRASEFHNQNVQKMRTEDEEFNKLSSADNPLGIPAPIAVHLSNSLNHDQAKKVFKELLSNENANLRMQNAALSGQYDDWLQKLLSNAMPADAEAAPPRTTPDLSREQTATNNDQGDDVLMDYIKNA